MAALALGVTFLVAVDFGLLDGGGERICHIWPTIDTRYAKGYSESAFRSIRLGMTREQVDRIMCAPLYINVLTTVDESPNGSATVWLDLGRSGEPAIPPFLHEVPTGCVVYNYTCDGAAPWGDFAWYVREVVFQDGRVTAIIPRLASD